MSIATPIDVKWTPSRRRSDLGAPEAVFAGLLVLGLVLVLVETRGMSFFGDEWDFVLQRRGLSAGTLLRPHGPHLVLIPILIFKVLLGVFGGGSYLPFRLMAALDLVLLAVVLGVVCRRFWGRWWGLAPVLVLVTLGPGGVTILWPFQVGYAVAVAAGLLSLVALDRRTPLADVLSCGALVVSLASGSQSVGFVAGATVLLVVRGDWRRRAWVVLIPAVLYGVWYAKYGHQSSETHLSLLKTSLPYSIEALSATVAGSLGVTSVAPQTGVLDITLGVPPAIGLLIAVATVWWRGWRPSPLFCGAAATLIVLWIAASVSNFGAFSRPANDPRYLSSDVALLLLCVCIAVPRPSSAKRHIVAGCLALAVIAATNAAQFSQQRRIFLDEDRNARAQLGALLILRPVVGPTFRATAGGDVTLVDVQARQFFSAVDAFGLREDSPAQIATDPEALRQNADKVLEAGEISLARTAAPFGSLGRIKVFGGTAKAHGSCLTLTSGSLVVRAAPGAFELAAGTEKPMTAAIGRFASSFDVSIANLPARSMPAVVNVPPDLAPQYPWRMMVTGLGGRVCYRPR